MSAPKIRRLLTTMMLAGAVFAAAPADLLVRARHLYNQGQFDTAIKVARQARLRPELADGAAVIMARALLERYRLQKDATDLTAARDALVAIGGTRLSPGERTELLVAWGEWCFLTDQPGVSSEMFEAALALQGVSAVDDRDRVLDWWAQALDLSTRGLPDTSRPRVYERILARMSLEQARMPDSTVVPYWLAAGARGTGDLDRAWHAAIAGWIRARILPGGGPALRADLDRLVTDALIPERARTAGTPGVARETAADMLAEWESVKKVWGPSPR